MKAPSMLLSLACVAAFAGNAAVAAPPAPASFVEAVDVELVNVQVWVTDRQGLPVNGLAASDFQLLHDDQPVAITHFAEVRGATVPAAPAAIAPAPAAPVTAAPVTAAEPPGGYLVLYFDQLSLQPRDYPQLVAAVEQLLGGHAVPAERVMVLRQDRDLHVEVPFGSSRELVDAALQRVAASRLVGNVSREDELISAVNLAWKESEDLLGSRSSNMTAIPEEGESGAEGGPRGALASGSGGSSSGGALGPDACDLFVDRVAPTVDAWVRERQHRTAMTTRHLSQTGAILAGLPGVKTLVYLSGGLETEPASPMLAAVANVCPGQSLDFGKPEMSRDLLALTRHLNTNQVTIHALQSGGLRVAESGSASSRGFAAGMQGGRIGSAFEGAQRASLRSGMGVLADETGGRLVVNQNDLGGELERIGREMLGYYSLAYAPPRGGLAGEHRIDVKLADRSLQARFRRGYREKDGDQRLRELLEGALYLGLSANPLEVRLGAGEIKPRGNRFVLPLHMFVPVERLVFVGSESPAAELRMQVLARNADNPRQEWQKKAFRVVRPAGAEGAADLAVELELDAGTHVVAIALRDEASRATSLVSTTVVVGR